MRDRVSAHKLKMELLDVLFERELRNMKVFCFSLALKKRYKALTFNLSAIRPRQKQALLKEYFNMCKTVYVIRSKEAYTWSQCNGTHSINLIKELYKDNVSGVNMI